MQTNVVSDMEMRIQELYRQLEGIREADERVAACSRAVEAIKLDQKEAKQKLAEAMAERSAMTRHLPLFDGNGNSTAARQADAEAWRLVWVGELGLSPAIIRALEENQGHPISTLGALCNWTALGNQLTGIKGIGVAAATKIEDALEKYWAENPPAAEAPEEDTDGDDCEDEEI